jgi:hypothetical protein
MKVEDFVSRLEKVKRTGKGSWLARCPAHEDRSPSLSVGVGDDGRILVRCFAECGAHAVVSALGLELSDLYPEREIPGDRSPAMRFPAADVLSAVADELMVVEIIAGDLELGLVVKQDDYDRLHLAIDRVIAAKEAALGKR